MSDSAGWRWDFRVWIWCLWLGRFQWSGWPTLIVYCPCSGLKHSSWRWTTTRRDAHGCVYQWLTTASRRMICLCVWSALRCILHQCDTAYVILHVVWLSTSCCSRLCMNVWLGFDTNLAVIVVSGPAWWISSNNSSDDGCESAQIYQALNVLSCEISNMCCAFALLTPTYYPVHNIWSLVDSRHFDLMFWHAKFIYDYVGGNRTFRV